MDRAQLIFPGPGDIQYHLPPGSMVVPLETAPSGHLVMVTDQYGQLPKDVGGLKDSKLVMLSRQPVARSTPMSSHPTREETTPISREVGSVANGMPPGVNTLPPLPTISSDFREALGLGDAATSRASRASGSGTNPQ